MCKSKAEGGQRCAAHTRPRYEAALPADPDWDTVATEYASTREGHERLTQEADAAEANRDFEHEARLRAALKRGEAMREANKEAAEVIQHTDLTGWEPANIDAELARLHGEIYTLQASRASDYEYLARDVARLVYNRRGFRDSASAREVAEAIEDLRATPEGERNPMHRQLLTRADAIARKDAQIDERREQMQPYNKEFDRRGGWNRAFLVTNGNGHVHKSMNCSTCRPTTQFYWVTEMSAKTEAEIVEEAGERACTCCFPSAPVDVLRRPTRLFTPEERAQQASRENRAQAAEQRKADKIAKGLTPDGSEFVVETGDTWKIRGRDVPKTEHFKTERAAVQWMVHDLAAYQTWRTGGVPDGLKAAHQRIVEAIAAKHGKSLDEVRADIEAKVQAKIRRDGR